MLLEISGYRRSSATRSSKRDLTVCQVLQRRKFGTFYKSYKIIFQTKISFFTLNGSALALKNTT